jgi:hypothetical protein
MAVDITINETIDSVDITVNPNIIEVNVTRTSGGGGGSQTLAQTLDLGNSTGGENILVNNADAIELQNGSLLKKGTYNFDGAGGGISRICSVGYEDMWQSGIRYVYDNNGLIRNASNGFDVVPDSSFDNTLRFKIDSLWTLDNGTTYICTDATEGAAVWEIYSVAGIPTLQEINDNSGLYAQSPGGNSLIEIDLNDVSPSFGLKADDGSGQSQIVIYKDEINISVNNSINVHSIDLLGNTIELNNLNVASDKTNKLIITESDNNTDFSLPTDKADGSYILATLDDIPTTTSQLTNDGADGVNPFITALDIPVAGEASTLVREVKNMTGATLTKGTVVFISGANGNKALVQKALATTDALSARTFGLLQSDILNNGLGNCVIIGDLSGINTSAFAEGAQLYLSGTVAGAFTDVRTLAPTHLVYIGKVTRSHPTQGQIEVQIQNGYELEEIHDVQIVTPLNNQALVYETSSQLWKNKTIIEDSIVNGVTDKAPSQNAVFDALDLTRRLITNGTGSVTGTTAETILTSLTIPANTLDSKCFIWSTMDYFKSSAANCTLRLYINTANSLSGATLIGFATVGSNRNVSFNRKLYLNGTTLDFLSSNTGATQISNEFIEAIFGASTTLTVNPAANIFLIYTTQNDAVGTTATSKQATVQKLKLN